jgi:cobyrinic acid a,c-diamide synthase
MGCDVLVVEGVMGLFDGSNQAGCDGSTAALSRSLDAPVLLVVDASAMSGSVAALVHGFASFDDSVRLAGVVLNQVWSEGHASLLVEALEPLGVPVLGTILRDDALVWRERHLGLVPVAEERAELRRSIGRPAAVIERSLELEAVLVVARSAPSRRVADPPSAREVARCRVVLCAGRAFSFVYPENLALLEQAGAELIPFDPIEDAASPADCSGLYAGDGFPEVYATQIGANRPLLDEIRAKMSAGMTTWAECGGLLLLCESLDGVPMANALSGVRSEMTAALTLGYRTATTRQGGFLGPAGTVLRGQEFHRATTTPAAEALELTGRFGSGRAGFVSQKLFASYLHQHLAATPTLAERVVTAVSKT